ncbi:hypothetical protein [Corynebacterium casei]|nr:hypothetical protein [Corynebacterium casei]
MSPHIDLGSSSASSSNNVNVIEASENLVDEMPVEWISALPTGEKEIAVTFNAGDLKCSGYRVDLEETEREIKVTLFEGAVPGAPEHCQLIGQTAKLLVSTDDPIGFRKIS